MRLPFRSSLVLALSLSLPFASSALHAQTAAPSGTGSKFKDTSMFKPPAGARVAIIEFEDLECPACSHAYPIVHAAAARYKIPLVRYDFPLQQHIWSYDAAIWARYLQDKVSPSVANDYRAAVFAAQTSINSKDDLMAFTRRFFQQHGQQMPFVADPSGQLGNEVKADRSLGEKMGLQHTPTIVVCTANQWVEVTDVSQLYQAIDTMMAHAGSAPAAAATNTSAARKPSAARKSAQ